MHKLLLSLSFLAAFNADNLIAAPTIITEESIQQMAQKGSPSLDQIQATLLLSTISSGQVKEGYSPELFGRADYTETNERAIIQFQPIFSPIAQAQIGVRQKMRHGFSAETAVVTDQRSASPTVFSGKFNDVTTTTLRFTVQMDLWKDLLGRLSKTEIENAQLSLQNAQIQKNIQDRTFAISLRRIYWSLVANTEALKISSELLKTSQRQADETRSRFKNSVAEADEVARYEAQVAGREGSILFLKYQRENYLTQLKNFLPDISANEFEIGGYDLKKTIDDVVACTVLIASEKQIPYSFTQYDEVISILRKIRTNASVLNSRYADPDVKLFGTVKATGVASDNAGKDGVGRTNFRGSYGASIDDIEETNRTGYAVGLQFTLPLGDEKDKVQKSKELYDEKRLMASINQTDAQLTNTHTQLVKTIAYLNEVIRAQKVTSEKLSTRLRLMKKKYEQARVSVNDLVQDQDALLNSELITIDTQLAVVNTIFDYLVIFTETPCTFNDAKLARN